MRLPPFYSFPKLTLYPVLRERYLRDDVSCGTIGCPECVNDSDTAATIPLNTSHPLYSNGHIVIPDTNVFLSQASSFSSSLSRRTNSEQMDLVESNLFAPPIILLQTVMEEVRHRSLPLYNRLKALARSDDKPIWIFYNEYRSCVSILDFRSLMLMRFSERRP